MTDAAAPRLSGQCRFDLILITAPVLALLCLALAVATSNFDAKLKHSGLTLMMLCMSVYVFHLKGRPIAERPPVEFTPFLQLLIVGFCLGTFFCGMGMTGVFGFAMQFVPTVLAIIIGGWLNTSAGLAKREAMAARAQ